MLTLISVRYAIPLHICQAKDKISLTVIGSTPSDGSKPLHSSFLLSRK